MHPVSHTVPLRSLCPSLRLYSLSRHSTWTCDTCSISHLTTRCVWGILLIAWRATSYRSLHVSANRSQCVSFCTMKATLIRINPKKINKIWDRVFYCIARNWSTSICAEWICSHIEENNCLLLEAVVSDFSANFTIRISRWRTVQGYFEPINDQEWVQLRNIDIRT